MRWKILGVLFIARTAMAMQYQAVAALSPIVQDRFGVGLAEIGWLIGLYLLPGLVVALPGSALARRFGDRNIVAFSLLLMALGGLAIAVSGAWEVQVAGRVVAGIGGVILNVVMTKMVADWFAGREIATAMALFIASWPGGIALALVVLPALATAWGFAAAMTGLAGFCALGCVLVFFGYKPAPEAQATAASGSWPRGRALTRIVLAGLVWAFLNVALAAVFAFGPELLMERGQSLQSATAQVSLVLWSLVVVVPLGGVIADKTGQRDLLIMAGCLVFAAALGLLLIWPQAWPLYVMVGAATGLAAGPIMTLPSEALPPPMRAIGMGVFFTIYYVFMSVGPAALGLWSEAAGSASAAYLGGLVTLALTLGAFGLFWLGRETRP